MEDRPEMFGPIRGFSVMANSMESCSMLWGRLLLPGCLQLLEILEISCNFINTPGKFSCQLIYDNMPITEPNLVTSLNPRNCHLTW